FLDNFVITHVIILLTGFWSISLNVPGRKRLCGLPRRLLPAGAAFAPALRVLVSQHEVHSPPDARRRSQGECGITPLGDIFHKQCEWGRFGRYRAAAVASL